MYEFETFVYLDVQKTGSTFICNFLRDFCTEKEICKEQHAGISENCDRSKFYFMSVRDPLDQYLSLYSYGCQTAGALYQRLERKGHGNLYNGTWRGFRSWLRFVLEPDNARLLGDGYGKSRFGATSKFVGLQSFRILTLAIPGAAHVLAACESKEEIVSVYKRNNIVNYTIKNETIRADLTELINTKLRGSISNLGEAMRFIEAEEPHNPSDRVDRYEANPSLGSRLRHLLEEREWLMYEEFGYQLGLA
jgi:hypothetical protein